MPPLPFAVVLWGEDQALAKWLQAAGAQVQTVAPLPPPQNRREVILVPPGPLAGGAEGWRGLIARLFRGSVAVFLAPDVFRRDSEPLAWLPLPTKGTVGPLRSWLYHKDEWAKTHPAFAGLPAGGMLDYAVYRELIPDNAFAGQEPPLTPIAGGIDCSLDYGAGLFLAESPLGAGRVYLNTFLLRENLERDPVAERLLRNLLRCAATVATDQPLAALPADFDQQLKLLGYR
jgi:hypothetical protein